MIIPGLTSATTRAYSVDETVQAAAAGGLKGIEWEAMRHVPVGDLQRAEMVRRLCAENGLTIPSYGSYYQCAYSEGQGMPFAAVLETAQILKAKMIRVWAGTKNYDQCSPKEVQDVIDDTLRIADMADDCGKKLSFEFHSGTLTNNADFALEFAREVTPHPAIGFSWQPPHGLPRSKAEASLEKMMPYLTTLHVFHWDFGENLDGLTAEEYQAAGHDWVRYPLEKGLARWSCYLAAAYCRPHWALLEFTWDNSLEQLVADAKILCHLASSVNS